jgi:hypothetical protein
MKMRLLMLLLALPMLMTAQTKKPKAPVTLDVDRLYAKYKDMETVTIHSADGDITAHVQIELNEAGKPYSVILFGYQFSTTSDLERVISSLTSAKEKAGYKFQGLSSVSFIGKYNDKPVYESVLTSLYQKGSQYAKYGMTAMNERTELNGAYKKPIGNFFYFEVGDVRRRSTGKQEPFTF